VRIDKEHGEWLAQANADGFDNIGSWLKWLVKRHIAASTK
jgi:hypothetical protein